jgi:hypothetical protein
MSSLSRVLGPAAVAAGLLLGTVPAFAQSAALNCGSLRFEIANPAPGSALEPGGLVIQGIADDTAATSGTGVDHVDFFLGPRDQGGLTLGSTVPGAAPGPFAALGSFQSQVWLPTNLHGGNDLVIYAHSAVTGSQAVVTIPIVVGESASEAGETATQGSTPTTNVTCTNIGMAPTSSTTTTTSMAPAPAATTTPSTGTTAPAPAMPAGKTVVLQISNPDPGATVLAGDYVTQGVAYDQAAMSGGGIDRVSIFLDDRDAGGLFLANATPGSGGTTPGAFTATIAFPTNNRGLHTLWYYAHSTVTGTETSVQVPIDVQ